MPKPPSNSQSKDRSDPINNTNQFFLSPDGRSHHSYVNGEIVSCFAPFHDESSKIVTALPAAVQRTIDMDRLLGFVCVGEAKEKNTLPWMCLYTSSSVFLFSIRYTSPEGGEGRGTILRMIEPFEKPLLSPLAPTIVRVRSAPEIARPGAMCCMLKENDGYSLVLFHGIDDTSSSSAIVTTTPLRFSSADLLRGRTGVAVENLAYDSSELQVVDFCFVSFASILILTNDGGVHGASPILFDGICVPRSDVLQMVDRLDLEIDEAPSRIKVEQDARVRQCKAAKRYWMDAFSLESSGDSYYVSASVLPGKKAVSQAMTWQPRIQGPFVMVVPDEETDLICKCIEPFGDGDIVEGFVVARHNEISSSLEVAFGVLPGQGAVLLPRFEFESFDDCHVIDHVVAETGALIERAAITSNDTKEEGSEISNPTTSSRALISFISGSRSCSLVTDPLDDEMIHIITKSRIVTVTTTAVALASKCFQARIDGKGMEDASGIRTRVWSSFDSTGATLVGAGVSKDVHLGHILVAKLSDGEHTISCLVIFYICPVSHHAYYLLST